MAILLCLAETASAVATQSLEKTASGNFFGDSDICAGEIAPKSLQPQWENDLTTTQTASGRQVWLSADPIGEAGGINLYAYVDGDPINGSDPLGLATAVCIGGMTGVKTNPFGHTALAMTGKGVFSFGTGKAHPLGSSFVDYLKAQSKYRDTMIYVLPTTPAQEKAIEEYLRKLDGTPLPEASLTEPWKAANDNCNTRTMGALKSAGIDFGINKVPNHFRLTLDEYLKNGGRGFNFHFEKGNNNADAWGAFDVTP